MVQFSVRSPTRRLAALFTFVAVLVFVLGTTTSEVAAGPAQFLLRNPRPVTSFLNNFRSFKPAGPPWAVSPENGFSAKPPTEQGIRRGLVLSPYLQ